MRGRESELRSPRWGEKTTVGHWGERGERRARESESVRPGRIGAKIKKDSACNFLPVLCPAIGEGFTARHKFTVVDWIDSVGMPSSMADGRTELIPLGNSRFWPCS